MSSGEGAEEAAKDAGDREAFFKTGETMREERVGSVGESRGAAPCGPAAGGGHCSAPLFTDLFPRGRQPVKERRCLSLLISPNFGHNRAVRLQLHCNRTSL